MRKRRCRNKIPASGKSAHLQTATPRMEMGKSHGSGSETKRPAGWDEDGEVVSDDNESLRNRFTISGVPEKSNAFLCITLRRPCRER